MNGKHHRSHGTSYLGAANSGDNRGKALLQQKSAATGSMRSIGKRNSLGLSTPGKGKGNSKSTASNSVENNRSGLTIADLPQEEKEKVTRLVEKLVELGQEHEQTLALLEAERDKSRATLPDETKTSSDDDHITSQVKTIEERLVHKDGEIEHLHSQLTVLTGILTLYQEKLKNSIEMFRLLSFNDNETKIKAEQSERDVQSLQTLVDSQKAAIESFREAGVRHDTLLAEERQLRLDEVKKWKQQSDQLELQLRERDHNVAKLKQSEQHLKEKIIAGDHQHAILAMKCELLQQNIKFLNEMRQTPDSAAASVLIPSASESGDKSGIVVRTAEAAGRTSTVGTIDTVVSEQQEENEIDNYDRDNNNDMEDDDDDEDADSGVNKNVGSIVSAGSVDSPSRERNEAAAAYALMYASVDSINVNNLSLLDQQSPLENRGELVAGGAEVDEEEEEEEEEHQDLTTTASASMLLVEFEEPRESSAEQQQEVKENEEPTHTKPITNHKNYEKHYREQQKQHGLQTAPSLSDGYLLLRQMVDVNASNTRSPNRRLSGAAEGAPPLILLPRVSPEVPDIDAAAAGVRAVADASLSRQQRHRSQQRASTGAASRDTLLLLHRNVAANISKTASDSLDSKLASSRTNRQASSKDSTDKQQRRKNPADRGGAATSLHSSGSSNSNSRSKINKNGRMVRKMKNNAKLTDNGNSTHVINDHHRTFDPRPISNSTTGNTTESTSSSASKKLKPKSLERRQRGSIAVKAVPVNGHVLKTKNHKLHTSSGGASSINNQSLIMHSSSEASSLQRLLAPTRCSSAKAATTSSVDKTEKSSRMTNMMLGKGRSAGGTVGVRNSGSIGTGGIHVSSANTGSSSSPKTQKPKDTGVVRTFDRFEDSFFDLVREIDTTLAE